MKHLAGISDISDHPWFSGTVADYRAAARRLSDQVLEWHGTQEERRFGTAQRSEAAAALGLASTHAQLAGDAFYHLRDRGLAECKKLGRGATDFYWNLTEAGLDVTREAFLAGDAGD